MHILTDGLAPARCATQRPNEIFVSASADGVVRLWDVRLDKPIAAWSVTDGGQATAVAFTPDGTQVLVGSSLGTCFLLRCAGDVRPRTLDQG